MKTYELNIVGLDQDINNIKNPLNDKVLDLLFILTQGGAMTISEIANKTKIHRSTVSRRLKQMVLDGTVLKEDDKYFAINLSSSLNDKVLDLLFILTQGGAMTISEIADKTKIHRSTVSRRLKLMMLDGTVLKEDNKYIAINLSSSLKLLLKTRLELLRKLNNFYQVNI